MAREVQTLIWCDPCLAEDVRAEAEEIPPVVVGPRGKPTFLALCEAHRKSLWDPFLEALRELGQPADHPAAARLGSDIAAARVAVERIDGPKRGRGPVPVPRPGVVVCPACGLEKNTRGALRDHARRDHDVILAVLEARAGKSVEGWDLRFSCRWCEAKFTHGAGRSAHERADHREEYEASQPALEEA